MGKIKNIIEIRSGYSAQVDLKEEFENNKINSERLSNYKPIKSHRKPFIKIANEIIIPNSKRSFILSGSYGTGKSHLCLMLANYFNNQSTKEGFEKFFNNFRESQIEDEEEIVVDKLKAMRKEGKYLICLCNNELNTHFETTVLRSIKEALEREEIGLETIDSYYLQAVDKIEKWEAGTDKYFLNRFNELLMIEYPGWSINKIKKELSNFNYDSIEIFKDLHYKVTTTSFEYDKDNLNDIIRQIKQSKVIKENFKGIVIFYDEFDHQLKNSKFDINVFQGFSQMCAASYTNGGFPICFIATTHRSFASYKNVFNSEDYSTASDRVDEIELQTEGVEDIISAVVHPKKDSADWIKDIEANSSTFNKLSNSSTKYGIFRNLKPKKLKTKIIENIYPMHPLATYSLLKIASDFGSNNRSVFTFFADEKNDEGSYDWYIKNNDTTNNNDELNFYTTDLLFLYFKSKIKSDNEELRPAIRDYVKNYENSIKEMNKNQDIADDEFNFFERIMKTMLIYEVIDMKCDIETLAFGLNLNGEAEIKDLESKMKKMCEKRIIFFDNSSGRYEFKKNDNIDIPQLIKAFKEDTGNMPSDIIDEIKEFSNNIKIKNLKKIINEKYVTPSSYNTQFQEDKKLLKIFVSYKEFIGEKYLESLNKEFESNFYDEEGYQGIIINVICENKQEITEAKKRASTNKYQNIITSIPNSPLEIFNDVYSLKACLGIETDNFAAQDNESLDSYTKIYEQNISNTLEHFNISNDLTFYIVNVQLENKKYMATEIASLYMESLFKNKRNGFSHEDINLMYTNIKKKNVALKEAIDILLSRMTDISVAKSSNLKNGDKKYIENVLVNRGALYRVQQKNELIVCKIKDDFSSIKDKMPALYEMKNQIKNANEPINFKEFSKKYIYEYGIGKNCFILYFSVLLRYFGDSISFISDINDMYPKDINNYEDMLEILDNNKYNNSSIIYEEINEYDLNYVKKLSEVFDPTFSPEKECNLNQVYVAIKKWYDEKSIYSKVENLYSEESCHTFVTVLNKIDQFTQKEFILSKLKTAFGAQEDSLMTPELVNNIIKKIKEHEQTMEDKVKVEKRKIVDGFKEIFNIKSNSYDSIKKEINNWIDSLNAKQYDESNEKHIDESKFLLSIMKREIDVESMVFVDLPMMYKFGKLEEWADNHTEEYLKKIRVGKEHIEKNIILVNKPKIIFAGEYENNGEKQYLFVNQLEITIEPNSENDSFYVIENDNNKKEHNRTNIYTKTTTDNIVIRTFSVDKDGNFSDEIEYQFINKDKKFEITKSQNNQSLVVGIPSNRRELKVIIKSLLNMAINEKVIKDKEIEEFLKELKGDKNE